MCRLLKITRSLVYYHINHRKNLQKERLSEEEIILENKIIKIFKESKNNYGTRKIKKMLEKEKIVASRKKISEIMNKYGLVSSYTVKQFKVHKTKCNEDQNPNILNREFQRDSLEAVVNDLTYVNVAGKWNYICVLMDLFNREIIGYAAGAKKDANLVYQAFLNCKYPLDKISIFHTDRGNEFKNKVIEEVLRTFKISRSLSEKGCPYDNAVAESLYHILKTEFVKGRKFDSLEVLERELFDYVNWYNNLRIHGSLDYMTPSEFREVSNII